LAPASPVQDNFAVCNRPEKISQSRQSKAARLNLCRERTEGLKVIVQCPFVKAWIDKHPDYADLLKA
jgi:hypothetical protein